MLFNELEILELRLEELNKYVDYFIIIESSLTHSGKSKPLNYKNNINKFKKFEDKIIYVVIEDLPNKLPDYITNIDLNWYRENFQRNQIKTALMQLDVNDKDIIMISDIDEIPDLNKIDLINDIPSNNFITCTQVWFNWTFEWVFENKFWPGTQITRWSYLKSTTPQTIRNQRYDEDRIKFKNPWGWHLSWFGTNTLIQDKLRSFAHQEIQEVSDFVLENKRKTGESLVTEKLIKYNSNYLPINFDILSREIKKSIIVDFE